MLDSSLKIVFKFSTMSISLSFSCQLCLLSVLQSGLAVALPESEQSSNQDLPTEPATQTTNTTSERSSELPPTEKEIPRAEIVPDDPTIGIPEITAIPEIERNVRPENFIPFGGTAHLEKQMLRDLFTKGKSVGHVQDNPKMPYRRLVQRTVMPTEPLPSYGAILTFDDQLVGDSPSAGSAIDIAKDLSPLGARALFFANVNGLSETNLRIILRQHSSTETRVEACNELFESKKEEFIATIRELLKIQGPADEQGNRQYTCEVFNHSAFHQDMSRLKVGTDKHTLCMLGITFIEQCLDEAYAAERPDWERARYFRFPFLHTPKDRDSQTALDELFTEHGIIAVGETQDSKDVDNYSANLAKRSLNAAKKHKRYNPRYGVYGETDSPIALFHTKTWKKIKPGVISFIKENR